MATRDFINTLDTLDTPVVSPFQSLYCPTLDAALDNTRLAVFVRQLHYLLGLDGGAERGGHHWIYKTFDQWGEVFPWSYTAVRSVVNRGRALGVLVTRKRLQNGMDYRIDYRRLRALIEGQGLALPVWFPAEVPDSDPVTLDMFIEHEVGEVIHDDSMDTSHLSKTDRSTCHPVTSVLRSQRLQHRQQS